MQRLCLEGTSWGVLIKAKMSFPRCHIHVAFWTSQGSLLLILLWGIFVSKSHPEAAALCESVSPGMTLHFSISDPS